MNFRNKLTRALCGAGLTLAFAIVPAACVLSPVPAAAQASSMSAMHSNAMGQVDINTASESQLRAVPGIGSAYAKRIVQNRPYSSKDQLVTKGVLPKGVYDKVKDRLVAHRMSMRKK